MQVFVKTVTGKVMPLTVEPSDTIESVKVKVAAEEGSPVGKQVFIFGHKTLEDDKTLSDYDIANESTIFMTLRLRSVLKLSIQTPAGQIVRVDAAAGELVEYVKAKIQEKEGIPADEQKLIYNGKQLENGKTLASYEITQNSTLQFE